MMRLAISIFVFSLIIAATMAATTEMYQPDYCGPKMFKCVTGSNCIRAEYICDGYIDCGDMSDEQNCPSTSPPTTVEATTEMYHEPDYCGPKMFKCDAGSNCIRAEYICDGYIDCGDMSDEQNCPSTSPPTTVEATTEMYHEPTVEATTEMYHEPHLCGSNQYECDNGNCIPAEYFCDGYQDCTDMSDEQNCTSTPAPTTVEATTEMYHEPDFCGENMFMCVKLYHCIPANYVCDGDNDCGDMADEQNCTSTHPPCRK